MTLAPERAQVRRARKFVVESVHAVGQEALADVVELLTSEIVTNVVLHAGGNSMRILVQWQTPTLRVEVCDQSGTQPRRADSNSEAATGRGLALVDALATAWGAEPNEEGKAVWFELDAG